MKYELRLFHQISDTHDAGISVTLYKDLLRPSRDISIMPKTTLADWDGALGLYTGARIGEKSRAIRLRVDPTDPCQASFADEYEMDTPILVHHVYFSGYLESGISLEFSFEEDFHGSTRTFKVTDLRDCQQK